MFSQTRIGTIVYYVSDIDRSEAFYRDVLGLEVQRMEGGPEGEGDWLLVPTAGGVELVFFAAPSQPGNSPVIVFDLAEGGIDGIVAGLAERGATIVTPVSHAPGGWSCEFADPDGHTLSMYQTENMPR